MLVEVLADAVVVYGASDELQMRCGFPLGWSMETRWEMRSRVPKCSKASWTGTTMPNPWFERLASFSLQNLVADGIMAEMWGPLAIPVKIEAIGYFGPTFARKPFVTKSLIISAAG